MAIELKRIPHRGHLAEEVYRILKEAVISGKFEPGAWLHEEQITRAMGISRTPLREALNRLRSEDLVEVIPRKGAYVIELNAKQLDDLFEVREVVETTFFIRSVEKLPRDYFLSIRDSFWKAEQALAAAGDSPERTQDERRRYLEVDRSFHDRIIQASENDYWMKLYSNIRERIQLYGHQVSRHPAWFGVAIEDHREIVEELVAGRHNEACERMRRHIRNIREALHEIKSAGAAPGAPA